MSLEGLSFVTERWWRFELYTQQNRFNRICLRSLSFVDSPSIFSLLTTPEHHAELSAPKFQNQGSFHTLYLWNEVGDPQFSFAFNFWQK